MPTSPPSSSSFSFKAPRRVSLALPSAPRLVQPWSFRDDTSLDAHSLPRPDPDKRGKMRKIAPATADTDPQPPAQEKKPRKKWTPDETQMLVDGCQRVRPFLFGSFIPLQLRPRQHGVGNWKTILSDPELIFDNRSPVDLKDR